MVRTIWPRGPQLVQAIGRMLALLWRAYPAGCAAVMLLSVIHGLLPLASTWVTKVLFDWLALRLGGNQAATSAQLLSLLAIQAGLTLAAAMLPHLSRYVNAEIGRRLTVLVQGTIFRKINSLSGLAPFENPQLYDTIRLAQQGAEFGPAQSLSLLTSLIQSLVTLISFIGVLISFNLLLAALVVLTALPQLYAQLKLGQARFDLAFELSPDERRRHYYSLVLATPTAAKEVRLFGLGNYFLDGLLNLYRGMHQAARRQEQRELRWELVLTLISSIVASVAFVMVAFAAFDARLTLGDITLYIGTVAAVQSALVGMVVAIGSFNECALFYSSFQALLDLPPDLPVPNNPQPVPPLTGGLELRGVSFRYSDQHPWILRNVNLHLPAGSCLALVGRNGAGKTTLVKLLTRLYDPTEGQILWDGVDIRAFEPAELRAHIGTVFQDFMRYDLTVRENIGLGNLERIADERWIQAAAQRAGVHDDLARLPKGYSTELSRMFAEEGQGLDLSGGQWQKVAIARMFAREAALLILDEPTAALDAEAEHEAYRHFTELVSGRTSLLISHRLSTVRMADRIAVLEDGHIAELGGHHELLAQDGTYARLYRMQAESYGAQALEATHGALVLGQHAPR